jgi:hypothetical protein
MAAAAEAPVWQQAYSVQLDPDSARRLATHGATILLLDVPEATPIGLDQQVCRISIATDLAPCQH